MKVAILSRVANAVSGSGYQCFMQKITVLTRTGILFDQSERTTIEPITLTPFECWTMIRSQKCKDYLMECDGSKCTYTS
jgi:hypothetical protein